MFTTSEVTLKMAAIQVLTVQSSYFRAKQLSELLEMLSISA